MNEKNEKTIKVSDFFVPGWHRSPLKRGNQGAPIVKRII